MSSISPTAITPRGIEIDEASGAPFAAVDVARRLLRTTSVVALATIDSGSGYPYSTVTNVAIEPDGTPYFFAAWLALHARNIDADPRISMTMAEEHTTDALVTPRLTLVGRATQMSPEEVERATPRFLRRFPKSKLYLALPDAMLFRMQVEGLQLNGGPARNANSDLTPAILRTDLTGTETLMAAESEEIERLNALDGGASRLATRAGAPAGRWRATGYDPDGLDLSSADNTARLLFGRRVTSVAELRQVLAL